MWNADSITYNIISKLSGQSRCQAVKSVRLSSPQFQFNDISAGLFLDVVVGDPGSPGEGGAGGARLVTLAPRTTAGTQSRLGVLRPARLMIFIHSF